MQRSGKGRETYLEVWKRSGDPPRGSKRVGRPTRRSGKGRETYLEVRKRSGNLPGGLRRVG